RVINSIHSESLQALELYQWPGNIRELENLVERSILTAEGDVLKIKLPELSPEHTIPISEGLGVFNATPAKSNGHSPVLMTLAENERAHIHRILQHTNGRISGPQGAAKILGLPASTLRSRMKKLGLNLPLDSSLVES
ncbi:MAG TPA: helix-turn-helix domain-containing protein, partial [Blastocatellia bacterium]|nr:helix-turn-helix domain-containing protein [Blastocatellia bacterium]